MFRNFLAAGVAAGALAIMATPAAARVAVINFTVDYSTAGEVFSFGTGEPFGLTGLPVLSGSVTVDSDEVDGNFIDTDAFLALDWTTGSRTWTLADIRADSSYVNFVGEDFWDFGIAFLAPSNALFSLDSARIEDGDNKLLCNNCFTVTSIEYLDAAPVPEPQAWALMLLGFGAAGAAIRRRRALLA